MLKGERWLFNIFLDLSIWSYFAPRGSVLVFHWLLKRSNYLVSFALICSGFLRHTSLPLDNINLITFLLKKKFWTVLVQQCWRPQTIQISILLKRATCDWLVSEVWILRQGKTARSLENEMAVKFRHDVRNYEPSNVQQWSWIQDSLLKNAYSRLWTEPRRWVCCGPHQDSVCQGMNHKESSWEHYTHVWKGNL